MHLYDSKQSFFDDKGNLLVNGRLRFYAYNTLIPIAAYADPDCITSLGDTVSLSAAGWTTTSVYVSQSASVHVDEYLGMDEYGQESYHQIKVFDAVLSASGSSGASESSVNTIFALQNIVPVDKMAVEVLGYYALGDSPARRYYFDVNSTASENGGTIIESSVNPVGRWLLQIEGPFVDCRVFGVIPGPITANAAFASLLGYCQTAKKTAYIPAGSYYLASGGSIGANCDVKVDSGTKIYAQNGSYTLTIHGRADIASTLAGTGLKLIFTNGLNVIPATAWNDSDGLGESENISIRVNANVDFTGSDSHYKQLILEINPTITGSENVFVDEIVGDYKISYADLMYIGIGTCKSSHLDGVSRALACVTKMLYVDQDFVAGRYAYPANICASGGIISGGGGSFTGSILGSNIFSLTVTTSMAAIEAHQHLTGNSMIRAYNGSTMKSLDMQGKSATVALSRVCDLYNASITSATAGLTAHNCTITGFSGNYLFADNCTISGIANRISFRFSNCIVDSVSGSGTASASTITTAHVYNNSSIIECKITALHLHPTDGSINSINVNGGTIDNLIFDAMGNVNIASTVNHTNIDAYITNIAQNIYIDQSWANEGHTLVLRNRKPDGLACNFNQKVNAAYVSQSTQGATYNINGIRCFVLGYASIEPAYFDIRPVSNQARVQAARTSVLSTSGITTAIVWEINTTLKQFYINVGIYQ